MGVGRRLLVGLLVTGLLAGCSTGADAPQPSEPVEWPTREAPEAAPAPDEPERGADDDEAVDPTPPAQPVAEQPLPEPPSRPVVVAEAAELLEGLLASAEDDDRLGVLVVDEAGREVLAHDPDAALLPASTLKMVTAAAALVSFGPAARFQTRIESTGWLAPDGTLHGDLVLVGTGDPVLATPEYGRWVYPARPRTPLEALVDQLVDAGVRTVDGSVLGVVDRFEGPSVAGGWPDRYFASFDARYADGLVVDAGVRTLVTYPEDEDDDVGDDVDDNDGDDAGDQPEGDEDGDVDPEVRIEHAPAPAEHAVEELVRLMEESEIEVRGAARVGSPDAATTGRLARVASPPMDELLRFALRRSDNQITDAIFRAVGRHRTGIGSFASGDHAVRQVLDRLDIDHAHAVFADGSGLSRDDRLSPSLLVELDRSMHQGRHAATWRSLMAVMGESGTLSTRLRNSPAAGRFIGKTGTLRDVSSLSGTVTQDGPRRYHLAVIANAPGELRWHARAFADELITLLAGDLAGCEVRPGEEDEDAVLGRTPVALAC